MTVLVDAVRCQRCRGDGYYRVPIFARPRLYPDADHALPINPGLVKGRDYVDAECQDCRGRGRTGPTRMERGDLFGGVPVVGTDVLDIVNCGGQILLPFSIGDAPVTFSSRWELARMIERAVRDAFARGAGSWWADGSGR